MLALLAMVATGRCTLAQAMLTEEIVRSVSSYAAGFTHESMFPADAVYSDLHLRAIALPERYDVALRVWQLPPALAADKLDELRDVLPKVSDTLRLGVRAFLSEDPDIIGVVFRVDGGVAMLTCGKDQCRNTTAAIELARRLSGHLTPCQ
jgi:hypothetical protein